MKKGKGTRRINVVDIESFEPSHKSASFVMYYYENDTSGGETGLFRKSVTHKHVLKEEHF